MATQSLENVQMESKSQNVHDIDPALQTEHQHHHTHHHHTAFAQQGHEEVAYTNDASFEKGVVPEPTPLDHGIHSHSNSDDDAEAGKSQSPARSWVRRIKKYRRHIAHAVVWLLFTGWWIASLVLHRNDMNWIIPFLLYLAITLRIVFFYVPISIVTRPMYFTWSRTARPVVSFIPEKLRLPAGALVCIATILIGAFASPTGPGNNRGDRAVSLFGLAVFLFLLYLTSRNRSKILWHTVIVGMLVQFLVALFVLRSGAGYDIFNFVATLARDLLGFSSDGVVFLTAQDFYDLKTPITPSSWFLITTTPAIIFFVSVVQLFYYFGVLQWFITKFAVFFFWSMRVSGAEAVVAAASPFIGQGESAMLVRPFVEHMTLAEIHQVMTSGFATIAGSVLIAYIAMGVSSQALVSSCVMSIPASLACSKIRWPEEEESLTAGRVVIPDNEEHKAENALHAFSAAAWLGLKIAAMMASTLLCIISLIGLANGLLTWWGRYLNINEPPLTLELILGYICYPIAFLLGVSRDNDDLLKVGQLIGLKVISNEFVAYKDLTTDAAYANLSDRSRLIVTYALCGFANIGSLGNQIGVLAQVSPGRNADISRVALSAMITGALSTFTSAAIAGMLITDEKMYISSSSS
ncbi:hypothetical protein N7478_012520 [Penicillium angulare]|uniref:uncharacterized protein n=1 Tax=Penicillium angulare TaxID=116970 RepID=UPI00254017DE|nr:uncharacterized protein N7478_012520 [Penicillium angulare]KAJ5259539.1 hypothetical protein N7478_012520 [Penicillium angulare]